MVTHICGVPHWPSYHLPWAALQTQCPCSLGWLAASGVSSSFSWKSISDRTHAHAAATQERKTRKFGNVLWLTPILILPPLCCPTQPQFYAWLVYPYTGFGVNRCFDVLWFYILHPQLFKFVESFGKCLDELHFKMLHIKGGHGNTIPKPAILMIIQVLNSQKWNLGPNSETVIPKWNKSIVVTMAVVFTSCELHRCFRIKTILRFDGLCLALT